jgi:hypothetical protein
MRLKIPMLPMALALLMSLGLAREARAVPNCTHDCQANCASDCFFANKGQCVSATYQCPACGTGGGAGTCNVVCTDGPLTPAACVCPSCPPPPGGSPIFRKQETKHSQPAKPDAKPEGKPAPSPESKPDSKPATKVEPKAEPKSASESKSAS